MTRGTRRRLTALAIVIVTLGLGALLIAATGGQDRPQAQPELDVHNGLLVSTRTEFQVCVEQDRSSTVDKMTVEQALRGAIDQVRQHPLWSQAYGRAGYTAATVLTWGCPGARVPERHERVTIAGPGVTADPSRFRVWVYVLGATTGERVLGSGRSADIATAELMGTGRQLFPVSAVLLIRDTELARPGTVSGYLGEAAGLPQG